MIRQIALAGAAALSLAACTAHEQRVAGTGATGAVVGGLAGAALGGDVESAATGALVGGAAGAVIGSVADRPGYCYTRDRVGRTVVVECPPNYGGGNRAATGAVVGATTGAVVGAATTGEVEGALVGAAVGGAAGAIVGHVTDRPGYCYARDQVGRTIVVECPPGY